MPVILYPLFDRFRNLYGYVCQVGTNTVIVRYPIPLIFLSKN